MTRHALHSGSGAAAGQSAHLEGQRAPERLWRAGVGAGPGRGAGRSAAGTRRERGGLAVRSAPACCWPRVFGGPCPCAPVPPRRQRSPPFSYPRSAPRGGLPCERVLGSPFQKACILRLSLSPSWPQKAHSEWNAPFTARGVQVAWDSRPLRPQREGPRCLAKAASHRGNRDRPLTPCLSNPARTQGCRLCGVAPSLWARVERPSEYLVTHG